MKLVFIFLGTVLLCALMSEAAPAPRRRVIIIIIRRRPARGRRDVAAEPTHLVKPSAQSTISMDDPHLNIDLDADKFIYTGDALDKDTVARLCATVQREEQAKTPEQQVQVDVEMLPLDNIDLSTDELTQVHGESELLRWRSNALARSA